MIYSADPAIRPLRHHTALVGAADQVNESTIREALSRLEQGLVKPAVKRSTSARKLNDEGIEALQRHDTGKALEAFGGAYRINPADIEITENLGYASLEAGNLDDAELRTALTILMSPRRATAWNNLGQIYARRGDLPGATACLATAFCVSRARDATRRFFEKVSIENPHPEVRDATAMALALIGQSAFSSNASDGTIPSDLARQIGEEHYDKNYLDLFEGSETKFLDSLEVRLTDLNRDGTNEYLVISIASYKCGSGSCDLLVYGGTPGRYSRLFGDGPTQQDNWLVDSVNEPQVRLAATSSAGYTDLLVTGSEMNATLKFDGKLYRIVDFGDER